MCCCTQHLISNYFEVPKLAVTVLLHLSYVAFVILVVVSFIFKEEHKLQGFKNKVLRKIFGQIGMK